MKRNSSKVCDDSLQLGREPDPLRFFYGERSFLWRVGRALVLFTSNQRFSHALHYGAVIQTRRKCDAFTTGWVWIRRFDAPLKRSSLPRSHPEITIAATTVRPN